jgi:hypothetical protein
MSRENPIVAKEDFARDLLYKKDFKVWLKSNPGVMKKVASEIRSLMLKHPFPEYSSFKPSNYHPNTEVFDTSEDKNLHIKIDFIRLTVQSASFKVTIGTESFFVKVQNPSSENLDWEGGVDEFNTAEKLRSDLRKLNFVDVVDYKMAYNYIDPENQKKGGLKFLVSGWLNLPTLANYLDNPPSFKERQEVLDKYGKVVDILKDYFDIGQGNCFYDKETKKIVLFDLHKKPWVSYSFGKI